MRQSPGPEAQDQGPAATPSHLFVSCLCHLSVYGVSSLSPLCPGRTSSRARGHPLTRDFNLSSLPSIPPHSSGSCTTSLTPSLGFYIYFLLSVFSVCTIPWGCDRGEGAGHVGITSVYVPPALLPPSWAPAPSSRPPPLEGTLSSLPSQTPPFLYRHPPPLWSPILTHSVICVPHVCPGGGPSPPTPSLQSPRQESAVPRTPTCSAPHTWPTLSHFPDHP